MTSLADISVSLGEELEKTARESKARAIAVALLDFESGFRFSMAGDRSPVTARKQKPAKTRRHRRRTS
jgi:hypothetical protein